MALPISAFIIAKNEADRIADTIQSVQHLVSEILVIDSGSTDGTQAKAASLGAKVISHEWEGYGLQKRFGEDQCANDWVLNLDADEVVSEALASDVARVFTNRLPSVDGYTLSIRDCLPGAKEAGLHAHTTKAVRLYRKSRGRYAASTVHDRVHFDKGARIDTLGAPVWHRSIRSISHAIEKLNTYSSMQAADMQARGKTPPWLVLRLYTEFCTAFFKSYILRLDILRGHRGFINAVTYAFSRFARIAKVWEGRGKK